MRYILYCRKKKFLGVLPDLLVTDTNLDPDHKKLKEAYFFQGMLEHYIPNNLCVLLLEDSRHFDVIKINR